MNRIGFVFKITTNILQIDILMLRSFSNQDVIKTGELFFPTYSLILRYTWTQAHNSPICPKSPQDTHARMQLYNYKSWLQFLWQLQLLFVEIYSLTLFISLDFWLNFFFEMGIHQPLHRKDAYGFYFIYSTYLVKSLTNNDHTSRSRQTVTTHHN